MLNFRRPALGLLVLMTLWPSLVFGQAQRAGVVTILEGQATVKRVVLPGPIPLKFKDDVFLQDRVETGEKSLVRLLLGGAALVTIRARTVATITETPGKSTINLDSGKISLAVARERLRPGDSLEIRTVNALAGIRGTVVVAEVNRGSSEGARQAATTNFYVLRGTISAVNLDPNTGAPLSVPQPVGVGQSFNAVGTAPPTVAPNPPVATVTAGLSPQQPVHAQAANGSQVAAQAVQTAQQLVQTLLGPTQGTTPAASQGSTGQTGQGTQQQGSTPVETAAALTLSTPTANLIQTETTTVQVLPPLIPNQESGGVFAPATETTTITTTTTSEAAPSSSSPPPPMTSTPPPSTPTTPTTPTTPSGSQPPPQEPSGPPPPPPPATFSPLPGLLASTALESFVQPAPDPVLVIPSSAGPLQIVGPAIQISSTEPLTLDRSLLQLIDGTVTTGSLLSVPGQLTSTTTDALLAIDPSVVKTTGTLIGISGTVSLAGPLLEDVGGTFQLGVNLVSMTGEVTSTGSSSLLSFADSSVNAGVNPTTGAVSPARLVNLVGSAATVATLSIGGSLLEAVDSTFVTTSEAIRILTGGMLTQSGTSAPLVLLTGGSMTTGTHLVHVVGLSAGGSVPTSLDLSGPLLVETNTTLAPRGNLLRIADGASVTSATTSPLVTMTGGSFTGGPAGSVAGSALLRMFSQVGQDGTSLTMAGPYIAATNAVINSPDSNVFNLADGATIVSATALPFASLSGGSVTTLADFFVLTADTSFTTPGQPTTVGSGVAPVMSLAGPLLDATNVAFTTGHDFIGVFNGASLTSQTTQPFVETVGSSFTVGTQAASRYFLSVGGDETSVSFAGSVLRAVDDTFTFSGGLMTLFNGATLTKTGPAPLFHLDGSGESAIGVSAARTFVFVGTTTGAMPSPSLTLSGSLLSAFRTDLVNGMPGVDTFTSVFISDGAVVTKTDAMPLLTLAESQFATSGNVLTMRRSPSSAVRTTMHLGNAYLLDAVDSTITTVSGTASACCNVFLLGQGAVLTSINPGALIRLTDTTVNAGGHNVSGGTLFGVVDTGIFAGETFNLTTLPSMVQLTGGLVRSVDSTISALASGLAVTRSTFVGGSDVSPIFDVVNTAGGTTWSFGGVNPFTSTVSYGALFSASAAVPSSGPRGDAVVIFQGPLLTTSDWTLNLTGDLAAVFNGAVFASTTNLPLITTSDSTYNIGNPPGVPVSNFRHLFVVGNTGGASGTQPALATLQGPLLSSANDVFNTTGEFLSVFSAGVLQSFNPDPFVTLTSSTLTAGAATTSNSPFLGISSAANASFVGPLLSATASTVNTSGDFVGVYSGSLLFSSSNLPFLSTGAGTQLAMGDADSFADLLHVNFGSTATFHGPLLASSPTDTITTSGHLVGVDNGGVLTSFSAAPFVSGTGVSIAVGTAFGANLLNVCCSSGGVTSAAFAGPLLQVAASDIVTSSSLIGVHNGGSLHSTTPLPFISTSDSTLTIGTGAFAALLHANFASSVVFNGPLLSSANDLITTKTHFIGIDNGATLTSTGLAPFIDSAGSTLLIGAAGSGASLLHLCCGSGSPAVASFSGPLLSMSGGLVGELSTAGALVTVGGSSLISTGTAPFISSDSATYVIGIPPGTFAPILQVSSFNSGTPGNASFAGPLLASVNDNFAVLSHLVQLDGRASLTTSAAPFVTSAGSTIALGLGGFGGGLLMLCCPDGISGHSPVATLNGSLLTAANSTISGRFTAIQVTQGAQLHVGLAPLVDLTDSSLTVTDGHFFGLFTGGTANTGGELLKTLRGDVTVAVDAVIVTAGTALAAGAPLIRATDTTLTVGLRLVAADGNLAIVTTLPSGGTYPLVALDFSGGGGLTTGSHAIVARGSATQNHVDPDFGTIPSLGTDRPIVHNGGGPMLDVKAARTDTSISTFDVDVNGNGVFVDTALLQATAPLIALTQAAMRTSGDTVNIFQKARAEMNDVVRLDRSRLDVVNGNLVNVSGGSLLRAQNLLTVANGSRVNILNGVLLNVVGNSFASIAGCLVCFGGANNVVTVTNGIAPTGSLFGVPIAGNVQVGASATSASVFPGLGANGNQLNVTGALVNVGAGSTLRIQ